MDPHAAGRYALQHPPLLKNPLCFQVYADRCLFYSLSSTVSQERCDELCQNDKPRHSSPAPSSLGMVKKATWPVSRKSDVRPPMLCNQENNTCIGENGEKIVLQFVELVH